MDTIIKDTPISMKATIIIITAMRVINMMKRNIIMTVTIMKVTNTKSTSTRATTMIMIMIMERGMPDMKVLE